MWECFRALERLRDIFLRQAVFFLAALVSGVLYFMLIKTLRATKQNPRKVALVRALIALYLLWLLCFIPYDCLEIYYFYTSSLRESIKNLRDFAPVALKDNLKSQRLNKFQSGFYGPYKRFVIIEAILGNLRFSFGFLNSVLLLILLKPFQKPPRMLYNFVVTRCKTIFRNWTNNWQS